MQVRPYVIQGSATTDAFDKYRKYTTFVAAGGMVLMELGGHHPCANVIGENQRVMPTHMDQSPGHENGPIGQLGQTILTTSTTSYVR